MLNIAVFYNRKKEINEESKKIIAELKDLGYQLSVEKIQKKTDLVMALGGDGTYLRVAQKLKKRPKPLLAVCLGRIGFMSEIKREQILTALRKFIAGKYQIDRRVMLDISLCRGQKILKSRQVLNDAVLTRYGLSRLFDNRVLVGSKEHFFRSDGVIIATPTGSTAYNLSAGGPIIAPDKKKIIVTPICAHSVNWKSVVVNDKHEILIIPEIKKRAKLALTFDGHDFVKVRKGEFIKVALSDSTIDFVRFKSYDFEKVLNKKIGPRKIC